MRDWGLNGVSGRYQPKNSSFDYELAMNRVRLPVLAVEIAEDPVAPPGAVDELLGKLRAATIVRQSARGIASDKPWRRHFSWARQPDEIANLIDDWLTRALGQRRQTVEHLTREDIPAVAVGADAAQFERA